MVITDRPIHEAMLCMTEEVKQKLDEGWTLGVDDSELTSDKNVFASVRLENPERSQSMTYKVDVWYPGSSKVRVKSYEVDSDIGMSGPWWQIESYGPEER